MHYSLNMAMRCSVFGFVSILLVCSSTAHSSSDPWPPTNNTTRVRFVTPNGSISCGSGTQIPCLTLVDYANDKDTYFVNDSAFIFSPGNHILNVGLQLTGIFNISFNGLPDIRPNITVLNSAGITWESCENIELSNIVFNVMTHFTYILSFEFTFSVKLSNITILGNDDIVGCSSIISQRSTVDVLNSTFVGIFGFAGAALTVSDSLITFAGNIFSKNTAITGGVMSLNKSTVLFRGNNSFVRNSAKYEPSEFLRHPSKYDKFRTCKNIGTLHQIGIGGAIYCFKSNLSNNDCSMILSYKMNVTNETLSVGVDGRSNQFCLRSYKSFYLLFLDNFSSTLGKFGYGGALFIEKSVISFNFKCNIYCKNNSASDLGGAIQLTESSMQLCGNVSMINNSAQHGGAIYTNSSNISIGLNCNDHNMYYSNNSASNSGGALQLIKSSMQLCGNISLINNSAYIGGAIDTKSSNISFGLNCSTTNLLSTAHTLKTTFVFDLNRATLKGGAIASYDDHLYFNENVSFNDNMAYYGGAIYLDTNSKLILISFTSIHFVNNTARKSGGAFYYDDSVSNCARKQADCFLSFYNSLENISLIFEDNTAASGGAVMHVGLQDTCNHQYSRTCLSTELDKCKIKIGRKYDDRDLLTILMNVSKITTKLNSHQTPMLADAKEIQFCQQQHYVSSHKLSVYPGENFNVTLAAIGPANLNVPNANIKNTDSDDENNGIVLTQVNHFIKINNICTNVSYYVKETSKTNNITVKAEYKLYHRNPCDSLVDGVDLTIDVKPCPLGFQLSRKEKICVCGKILQAFTQKCDITTSSIERKENTFWVSIQFNDSGLILHKSGCPFHYCKEEPLNVPLSDPDVQCDFNRNGILCGKCKENYSLALGTLHCIKCGNSNYMALLLPFALAGIVFVIVILFLHLTVDVGTLNGLIFYVNIVHSNHQAFSSHHPRETNTFLTVFLAWLNLDFGIETCFYKGINIYTYSWLQFVFPFYIWFLIGAIIFVSSYSKRVSKCLGQNPVAALATLLFVSYGKLLNAIITPLSLTHLTLYSSDDSSLESTHSVWLYDGSIEYFKDPKHIILALFSVLTILVVFLPYTFLLLCGHWLMAYSDKCILSWLNRIKPFMDVYYAPFKKEGRYWIGLVLLSRLALLLTIAINAVGSDSVNILVIASVTAGLLFIKRRVYENNYIDLLESSFIFNLCVLSIATFYLKGKSPQSQYAVSSASIAISFMTFVGILLFHIYLQVKSTSVWRDCFHRIRRLLRKGIPTKDRENLVLNDNDLAAVTSTIVELREPLLDNDEA